METMKLGENVHKKENLHFKEVVMGYLFLLPSLLIICLVTLYPTLDVFYLSFRKVSLILRINYFNGVTNYINMVNDKNFINAFYNTIYFTFFSVFLETILGVIIALVINKDFKGRGIVRAAILVPWAIPTVVTSTMWKWIFNTDFGVINFILKKSHIIEAYVNWLGNPSSAMWTIIIADVWKTTPFIALLVLAGLQTVPNELYESARIDGSNALTTFIHVTLPIIAPTILVAVLLRTLDAFRVFDLIFVLTNGGPANGTEVLSTYAYKVLFDTGSFGYGSTLSVSVFMTLAFIALIFLYFIKVANIKKGV